MSWHVKSRRVRVSLTGDVFCFECENITASAATQQRRWIMHFTLFDENGTVSHHGCSVSICLYVFLFVPSGVRYQNFGLSHPRQEAWTRKVDNYPGPRLGRFLSSSSSPAHLSIEASNVPHMVRSLGHGHQARKVKQITHQKEFELTHGSQSSALPTYSFGSVSTKPLCSGGRYFNDSSACWGEGRCPDIQSQQELEFS